MDMSLEKECSALGGLFQSIVSDLKGSYPAWEDFGQKAVKLSAHLKATIVSLNQFLDALQRVADFATNAKGATRDIGTALTRICMRHRSIENRLKTLSSSIIDCVALPLQEKQDEWRNRTLALDKEHAKEYKRARTEIKKRSTDTIRLQKKVRKGESRIQPMFESALQEVNERYMVLLETERKMVRQALIEQRSQFCYFVSWLKPVLDLEMGLLEEAQHLNDVTDQLCSHSAEPNALPPSSEAVILDIKGLEHTWTQQIASPPSSPSSLGSRKSSFCSLSSAESQQYQHMLRYGTTGRMSTVSYMRNECPPPSSPGRFSTSQDSGFAASQDVIYAPIARKMPVSDEDSGSTPESCQSQQSTPSPSPSAATWPEHPLPPGKMHQVHAHTISTSYEGVVRRRPAIGNATFARPPQAPGMHRPDSLGINSNEKPPVPRKLSTPLQTPTPTVPARGGLAIIPDFNAAQPDQVVPQPIYANLNELNKQSPARRTQRSESEGTQRHRRPLSFVGDEEDMQRLLQVASMGFGRGSGTISKSGSNVTVKADDDDATLIDEALESIAALSTDLDRYVQPCATLPRVRTRENIRPTPPPVPEKPDRLRRSSSNLSTFTALPPHSSASSASFASVLATPGVEFGRCGTLVRRTASTVSGKNAPPPPVRRNSSITAATPTAPPVDVVRSNSRCTTPVEETYTSAMHELTMRFSQPPDSLPLPEQSPEFCVSHETLLMQIRNGVQLRPTHGRNDKSMPKI